MKALVLTHDTAYAVSYHMMFKYHQLWPDNPFTFRIPYQSEEVLQHHIADSSNQKEYIKTPLPISDTVLTLLEDLEEEQWVFWCMDDWFPVEVDTTRVEQIVNWLKKDDPVAIDQIGLCGVAESQLKNVGNFEEIRDIYGNVYTYYIDKRRHELWPHRFIRVKVLRSFFSFKRLSDPVEITIFSKSQECQEQLRGMSRVRILHRVIDFKESTTRHPSKSLEGRTRLKQELYDSIKANNLPMGPYKLPSRFDSMNMGVRRWLRRSKLWRDIRNSDKREPDETSLV